ncbi:putative peroxiredoxin Q, chloroplastic isoform X1 [Oryza brachyantha]|uniref:putative peroxiredoxin Q, chloroplastic isoform X1 n=1 Tax=Oryza brachyantha TaxID=4533 RepID=UPI001ADB1849|nr:putative peroxiredoxin Q, chloroplastic isoform X1 [Oryza brachyantha]
MAFAATTACRPSLLMSPRRASPPPPRALLCRPSTASAALRAAPAAAALSNAPPRRLRAGRIVCGKVTTTTNLCISRRSASASALLAWAAAAMTSGLGSPPRVARAADDDSPPSVAVQVSKGSPAPNFSLKDQDGKTVSLSKFKGKPVVVYFYPADETPGCTKQACAFRDSYEKFKKAGAEVIGISGDDSASHKEFKKKYKLPFTLLSDEGNRVRKEWGVPADLFGTLPGRQTYVLDKSGVVQYIYNNQFQPEKHIGETLKILQTL